MRVQRVQSDILFDEVSSPLIKSSTEYQIVKAQSSSNTSRLMTHTGELLENSNHLLLPQARYVSRYNVSTLKSYSITKETKDMVKGVAIKSKSIFSIYQDKTQGFRKHQSIVKECECIFVMLQVFHSFRLFFQDQLVLTISHTHLVNAIANEIGIKESAQDYHMLYRILSRKETDSKAIENLCKTKKNQEFVEKLSQLDGLPIKDFVHKVKEIFGKKVKLVQSTLDHLESIHQILSGGNQSSELMTPLRKEKSNDRKRAKESMLEKMKDKEEAKLLDGRIPAPVDKMNLTIEFSTALPAHSNMVFHSGINFVLSMCKTDAGSKLPKRKEQPKTRTEVAVGGRFDNIIESYKYLDSDNYLFGCGVIIKNYHILSAIEAWSRRQKESENWLYDIDIFTRVSVMVVPAAVQNERDLFIVASELWKVHIKCEISQDLWNNDQNEIDQLKRKGIMFLVVVKDLKHFEDSKLRVRNMKTSKEVTKSLRGVIELIKAEQSEFQNLNDAPNRDDDMLDALIGIHSMRTKDRNESQS